jgi:hypothetical protein
MKGYDVFFEIPGTVSTRSCQVCGVVCNVERNRVGPTGWATAVAKAEMIHDYFYCPHSGQSWHEQALALVQAIENTPSKRVAALMQQDLTELLDEHGCGLGRSR